LFDFFRKVARKLVADLKVPFLLKGGVRQDDTPLHRALREALVNTLVHADYSDRASILVMKRRSGFVFRNPGVLRVPAARALQGGESDCRNRILHQMFLMIGVGERAGSGLPKIRQGWEIEGGRLQLSDSFEPYDETRLELLWATGKSSGKDGSSVLSLLRDRPRMTIPDLAQSLCISSRAVEKQIAKQRQAGRLRRIGPAKGGHWQVLDTDET
jgi:ATP-dependent DNA helicase RecG